MRIDHDVSRNLRRHLLRLGRESGDPATALRFHAAARLGLGKTSSKVAEELDLARSTVVRTAHRFAEEGSAGLYDKRRNNGSPQGRRRFPTSSHSASSAHAGALRLASTNVDQ